MTAEKVIGGIQGEYYQVDDTRTIKPLDNIIEKFEQTNLGFQIEAVNAEQNGIKKPWILEEGSTDVDRYVGMPGTPYEGLVIKGRVSDEVRKYFYKMQIAKKPETDDQRKRRLSTENIRKETGNAGHKTLQDLVELYANGQGSRAQILRNSPFNEFQFKRIEDGVKDLIKQGKAQQAKINK